MPDSRKHRGPGPGDDLLFAPDALPALRAATGELSWLKSRGYSEGASLKLVGDRHRLTVRQRKAISRCACTEDSAESRRTGFVAVEGLAGREVHLDGFNCLIVTESALSMAPLLVGRDGALRDLASVHGTWRRVEETWSAIEALGMVLQDATVPRATWLLDRPVSNSGKLRGMLLDAAEEHGWHFDVELVANPDAILAESKAVVASADAWVLDRCTQWTDLPRAVVDRLAGPTWLVELG